jgi:hypothetical protein
MWKQLKLLAARVLHVPKCIHFNCLMKSLVFGAVSTCNWREPNVSEEHITSMFRVLACRLLLAVSCFLSHRPWSWRRYVSPKRRGFSKLHGVTSHKTALSVVTAVISWKQIGTIAFYIIFMVPETAWRTDLPSEVCYHFSDHDTLNVFKQRKLEYIHSRKEKSNGILNLFNDPVSTEEDIQDMSVCLYWSCTWVFASFECGAVLLMFRRYTRREPTWVTLPDLPGGTHDSVCLGRSWIRSHLEYGYGALPLGAHCRMKWGDLE